jgi:hypothetical protein
LQIFISSAATDKINESLLEFVKKCVFHRQQKSLTEKCQFASVIYKNSIVTGAAICFKLFQIPKIRGIEMRKITLKEAREIFEEELGKRISDASWYRLKTVFGEDFPHTKQNVIWLAGIKKQLPKCDLRLVPIVNSVREANQLIANQNSEISGKELLELFEEHNITIHPNTLTKWFKPLNGFRKTRVYELKELYPVILAAHTYKLRREINTVTQSIVKAS